nr:acetyltransferase [uncultured Clostridium sp.]
MDRFSGNNNVENKEIKDIVIIGAGGFGREIVWLISSINKDKRLWNLIGFIDEDESKIGKIINGYKVLGNLEYFKDNRNIYYVCAIGNAKSRKEVVEKCREYKIKAATLIDPSVKMDKESCSIGEGSIICAGNILTTNINIKDHIIINLSCTIGHDVVIEDFVTIYPGVNVSGNCNLGSCSELGTGSKIIEGKSIGSNSIIGAGTVVIRDIKDNCTAVGVPAKIIKDKDRMEN